MLDEPIAILPEAYMCDINLEMQNQVLLAKLVVRGFFHGSKPFRTFLKIVILQCA